MPKWGCYNASTAVSSSAVKILRKQGNSKSQSQFWFHLLVSKTGYKMTLFSSQRQAVYFLTYRLSHTNMQTSSVYRNMLNSLFSTPWNWSLILESVKPAAVSVLKLLSEVDCASEPEYSKFRALSFAVCRRKHSHAHTQKAQHIKCTN